MQQEEELRVKMVEAVERLTKEKWDADRKPLLTSHLGTKLRAEGINSKDILKGGNITTYIKEISTTVKVVQHPHQFAKIGLIPSVESYTFPIINDSIVEDLTFHESQGPFGAEDDSLKRRRGIFYSFIRSLSDMPKDQIDTVVIPPSVIVWFLEGK